MDKFLIELLQLNDAVILPDFGSIVIANENTGEVMFNEYLKFNDGKLVALIVANSTMDAQDASNMVAKYIRDIQIQLDKGESYDIYGLGSFRKDKRGVAIFTGNINSSNKKEAEIFIGPSPTPPAVAAEEENTPSNEVEEKFWEHDDSADEETKEETEERIISETTTEIVESSESTFSEETPQTTDHPKKEKATEQRKEKKKRGILFWILIFFLLVLSAGGVFIGVKYEEVITYMGWDKFNDYQKVADVIDTQLAKEINTETDADNVTVLTEENTILPNETEELTEAAIEAQIVEELIEQPTAIVSIDGKPFHLIGGSFSDETNATNFAASLKAKGLPAHVIGQFDGRHMVSVKSFATRDEAMNEIVAIKNEAPGAWLFKHPK